MTTRNHRGAACSVLARFARGALIFGISVASTGFAAAPASASSAETGGPRRPSALSTVMPSWHAFDRMSPRRPQPAAPTRAPHDRMNHQPFAYDPPGRADRDPLHQRQPH
jgi:hypothetical protein